MLVPVSLMFTINYIFIPDTSSYDFEQAGLGTSVRRYSLIIWILCYCNFAVMLTKMLFSEMFKKHETVTNFKTHYVLRNCDRGFVLSKNGTIE